MKRLNILLLAALLLAACAPVTPAATPTPTTPAATPTASGPRPLTVMTHDSWAVSADVVAEFETANNAKLQFIKSGDAGEALNKAILAKGNPLADVFYGVDNTYLSRALDEGIFDPYKSPALADIPDSFKLDPANGALPVDYGDVCLNYDKAYFAEHNLQPPSSLEDLTKPEYKDLLVVENPATSSTGLAFLLATIGHFGAENYIGYWKNLRVNGVKAVDGWETAYNTEFSGSSGKGPRPLVVSYGSSPPFEVIEATSTMTDTPTAAIISDDTCFRQIEFVGILKGAKNHDLAEKWVDFMLSTRFQEDMPLQMYVFPVNPQAKLNETFQKYLAIPKKPAYVSPADIAAHRDEWIQAWTEAVLH